MTEGVLHVGVEELLKDLKKVDSQALEVKATFESIAKTNFSIVGSNDSVKISAMSKQIDDLKNKIKALQEVDKESVKVNNRKATALKNLALARSKEGKEILKIRTETNQLNKVKREEIKGELGLIGAYAKLNKKRTDASRTLRNLIASEKASNKEIRKAQREFDRLDKKVRKADRSTKDFTKNVGNYKSAFGKAGFALRSFIGLIGVYSASQLAVTVFNQVRELEALDKALKLVTGTQEVYARSQAFVNRVAEDTGAKFENITRSYTKFLASAKTTNLTLTQTEDIFSKVAKAGASLGLSQDDLNGSFRALEQILSKGTVQAEEIRGQLGERLPGAFQILAKSMGLTTQELNKQLELGNVISDEVLPKFADELEKTFGLKGAAKVNTVNASLGRLSNGWITLITNIEDGKGVISNFFKEAIDGATKLLDMLNIVNNGSEKNAYDDTYAKQGDLIRENVQLFHKAELEKITDIEKRHDREAELYKDEALIAAQNSVQGLDLIVKERQELESKLKIYNDSSLAKKAYIELSDKNGRTLEGEIKALRTQEAIRKAILDTYTDTLTVAEKVEATKKINANKSGGSEKRDRVEAIEAERQTVEKLTKEYANQIQILTVKSLLEKDPDKKTAIEDEIKLLEKKTRVLKNGEFTLNGVIGNLQKQLDITKELISLEIDNGEPKEVKRLLKIKKALEDNIKLVKQGELVKVESNKAILDSMDLYVKSQEDAQKRIAKAEKGAHDSRIEQLNELADKLELVNDFQNAFADLGIAITERRIVKLENEKDAVDDRIDSEIESNNRLAVNEEERNFKNELLEEERRAKKKKIDIELAKEKTKQAKIDKAASIISATIHGAVATLRALEYGIPNAVAVGILSAIEIAAIIATPIPKFKMGKESSKKYQGLGIVNDGEHQEFRQNKNGIEAFKGKNTLTWVGKDDIIHPNYQALLDYNLPKLDYDAINRSAIMTSLSIDRNQLNDYSAKLEYSRQLSNEQFKNDITNAVKSSMQGWKHSMNIDNTGVGEEIKEALNEILEENRFL